MQSPRTAEVLYQTPEQKLAGLITVRIYLDDAWRNLDVPEDWKRLPKDELYRQVQQHYLSAEKSKVPG